MELTFSWKSAPLLMEMLSLLCETRWSLSSSLAHCLRSPVPRRGLVGVCEVGTGDCGVEPRNSAEEDVAKAGSWVAVEMSLAAEKV